MIEDKSYCVGQKSSLLQAMLPGPAAKVAAARPALEIYLAKEMLASCLEPAPPVAAAGPRPPAWVAALVPPGLPVQQTILRTNREAKPIQTVRAAYPPMALRAGLESDVTLRIEVDPQGNVTKAEITTSGGAGFDEEALKAVKQSRFEPAQRDGQNVPAEFTFVYRFRLQR